VWLSIWRDGSEPRLEGARRVQAVRFERIYERDYDRNGDQDRDGFE
jgi:hypothetical protein